MKIAIPITASEEFSPHYGAATALACFEADDTTRVLQVTSMLKPADGTPCSWPDRLQVEGITVMLVGGMGRARGRVASFWVSKSSWACLRPAPPRWWRLISRARCNRAKAPAATTDITTIIITAIPTSMRVKATVTVHTEPSSPDAAMLATLSEREHETCFACGNPAGGTGLGLRFQLEPEAGAVVAEWRAPGWAISYGGVVHGGLIATALDSAMVHALFARHCCARTAELSVRYRHPVLPAGPCEVRARLLSAHGPVFRLEATLRQAGRLCARATATFMDSNYTTP
jgi:acyl-coenzyme A thioesterase PaaI-like protein